MSLFERISTYHTKQLFLVTSITTLQMLEMQWCSTFPACLMLLVLFNILSVRIMNMGTPMTLLPFDLPVHQLRSLSASQYFSTSLIICHYQLCHPTVSPHSKTVRRPGAIHNPRSIYGVIQPAIYNDVLNPINCSDFDRCTLYHNELHRILGDTATVLDINFT